MQVLSNEDSKLKLCCSTSQSNSKGGASTVWEGPLTGLEKLVWLGFSSFLLVWMSTGDTSALNLTSATGSGA
jgi:hypothetical protein